MNRTALIFLVLVLAGCGGGPSVTPDGESSTEPAPGEPAKIPAHETYLRNPTLVRGDEVRMVLPVSYGPDLSVRGLSTGWREEDGKRIWEGTGDCELRLLSLVVRAKSLSLTLVPVGDDPQVMIQAVGGVSLAHSVRGVGTLQEDLLFLQITNDLTLAK